jgi:PDZ domain-containing protein
VGLVHVERPSWLRWAILRRREDVSIRRLDAKEQEESKADSQAAVHATGEFPLAAEAATVAALVQAKLLKQGSIVGTGVHVVDTLPGLGVQPGDTIVRAAGQRMSSTLDWQRVLDAHTGGDLIPVVTAERPHAKSFVWLVPRLDSTRRRSASALVEDRGLKYDLGFKPTFEQRIAVEGPSAGLAMSLEVYQSVTKTDLLRSRTVYMTGAIESSGDVGPVGGIRQKVIEAVREKPDLVIVPISQVEDARKAAAGSKLPIVGTTSLSDAIELLALPTADESAVHVADVAQRSGLGNSFATSSLGKL